MDCGADFSISSKNRFWFPLLLSFAIIAGMAVLSTKVVPLEWRVTGEAWAVILPLAYVPLPIVEYPYSLILRLFLV